MNHKVTVALPVYNVAAFVENALLSALNQTFESIEYLIVNDKGTDNSMEIVHSVIASHPRGKDVSIIEHDRNMGIAVARNTAIENARGKYLYFMDSDDEIVPDCIEILYNKMLENPVDFIAGSIERKKRNGKVLARLVHKNRVISNNEDIANDYFDRKLQHVFMWNKLYNLSFLRKNNIKCIPNHLNEDNVFTFQVILNAFTCIYIPNLTYHYYDTPGSASQRMNSLEITNRLSAQYIEITDFKIKYIQNIKNSKTRECVSKYIIFKAIYNACLIHKSEVLTNKDKDCFLDKMTTNLFNLSQTIKSKNKLFLYIMNRIYFFPLNAFCFRIIRRICF